MTPKDHEEAWGEAVWATFRPRLDLLNIAGMAVAGVVLVLIAAALVTLPFVFIFDWEPTERWRLGMLGLAVFTAGVVIGWEFGRYDLRRALWRKGRDREKAA